MNAQPVPDQPAKKKWGVWRVVFTAALAITGLLMMGGLVILGGIVWFFVNFANGPGQAGRGLLDAIVADDYPTAMTYTTASLREDEAAFAAFIADNGLDQIDEVTTIETLTTNEGGSGAARAVVVMTDGTERPLYMQALYSTSSPVDWVIVRVEYEDEDG